MKRDWELIRKILLEVEDSAPDQTFTDVVIDGFDTRQVDHHVALLIEAGLLHGSIFGSLDLAVSGHTITGLTWAGHDFVEKARSEVLWRKAMKKTAEAGTGLSFGVLGDLLAAMARTALGV